MLKSAKSTKNGVNPYDLNSVAKHTNYNQHSSKINRSLDINSAGGKNSTVNQNIQTNNKSKK